MRLSSLVILIAALFLSFVLFAPTSSATGGSVSSSGGHSGGGSSSGSSGMSHTSSGASHSSSSSSRSMASHANSARVASQNSAARSVPQLSSAGRVASPSPIGLNIRPNLLKSAPAEEPKETPEKKGIFSFLHHKKPEPELQRTNFVVPRFRCRHGQNCFTPTACRSSSAWNSSYCGVQYDQYYWFGACQALADQLAAGGNGMRSAGDSLRYRMLREQYEQCMQRCGQGAFSSYLFMSQLDYP
ncbi:MAG: hypothetical protein WCB53_02670 [Terriglobales bacterium]